MYLSAVSTVLPVKDRKLEIFSCIKLSISFIIFIFSFRKRSLFCPAWRRENKTYREKKRIMQIKLHFPKN